MASSYSGKSGRGASTSSSQFKVIHRIRGLVDEWRGFKLGRAAEPYPNDLPRYEPRQDEERPITETTRSLLMHWFRREPHLMNPSAGSVAFKYWSHQRRLVETFIYLYEVRGVRKTEQIYTLAGVEPLGNQKDPWAKLGGQLATGSGKTKMMALLIAWAYLNAIREPESGLGFGPHSILIAPGLFVRDRLLQEFAPENGASVFFSDPVLPAEYRPFWNLKVYSPANFPEKLDDNEGALLVTNYHQLLEAREPANSSDGLKLEERQLELLFRVGYPSKLDGVRSPLIERFSKSKGILVLNDEAHHVWDEIGHAKFETKKQESRLVKGDDAKTAMGWIHAIRHLNRSDGNFDGVALQVDLSATLFEEQGANKSSGKKSFRGAEPFRHTVVHYSLSEAISDEIVKKPILERVLAKDKKTGEPLPLINERATNAWDKYRNLLTTGIERWKKVRDQLSAEGDSRKPLLFIICADKNEAHEVTNFLTYGQAVRDDLSQLIPTGYSDPQDDDRLFLEKLPDGSIQSTVLEIHVGKKEESNEAEWEAARKFVNLIDQDEVSVPSSEPGALNQVVRISNPYNVIVSVMMLKEGWDVRNVKVIVPLRPCDSRTLTEQTLGRGLRKMHPPIIDEDGAAKFIEEDLFVIQHPSFQTILDQICDIMEEKSSDEIEHPREYTPILQNPDEAARDQFSVTLARLESILNSNHDWSHNLDVSKIESLDPRIGWMEDIPEAEIFTFLKKALASKEEQGQNFLVPSHPSYRDFDHVLEGAFAVPILKEMRVGLQYKTAVKAVARAFLEQKTFATPSGLPISFFDRVESAVDAKIALGNLAKPEVIGAVKKALIKYLSKELADERPAAQAFVSSRNSSDLISYQAIKKHVLEVKKSCFTSSAFDSGDELRVAVLLDQAQDVMGWLYNHRSGVGFFIEYDWQGSQSHYYPDFIVRAKFGHVIHNFIIEVKGRMDDRDKAKANRGKHYCEMLSEYGEEPWHYLLLLENASQKRDDVTWWEKSSSSAIFDILKRHEKFPLVPGFQVSTPGGGTVDVVKGLPDHEKFKSALPVVQFDDLIGVTEGLETMSAPEWVRVQNLEPLDSQMFVTRLIDQSMEDSVPAGSWCVFRLFSGGVNPSAKGLDGKRVVVVALDNKSDVGHGKMIFRRWRVSRVDPTGEVLEIALRPDNVNYKSEIYSVQDGNLRLLAELVDVLR